VHRLSIAIALAALTATSAGAQTRVSPGKPFDWTGQIASGGKLRIIDVHGDIHVTAASGDRVVVHADVRSRGGHDGDLTFDVVPDGSDMLICARWSDGPPCTAEGIRHRGYDSDNDGESAKADFTVQLPRNLRVNVGTGNGAVDVAGTGSDVEASSGNGVVRVSGATGRVDASSGNGEVTVENAGGPVSASTGNGTVTVALPANFSADLDAETGHGAITSDFPLQISGRFGTSHMSGTIGSGGPRIHLSSGNGDLILRKI
jgi:hypothetical protein